MYVSLTNVIRYCSFNTFVTSSYKNIHIVLSRLICAKIDCSVFQVTVTVASFKNIVAYRKSKRFKPILGNSNVHRRRNLDIGRSASEIISYRGCIKYACAGTPVFTVRVLFTIEFGGIPCMESRDVFICSKNSQTSMKLP